MKITKKKIEYYSKIINYHLRRKSFDRISNRYNINGFKRIYHIHIRKTGGTSLNYMFLATSGRRSEDIYNRLAKNPLHKIISNGNIYVGWNTECINSGT